MIPRRLIRSVPAEPSDEVEAFWAIARDLHPGWELVTYQDPIDPDQFPRTAPVWDRCHHGAQLAGLIRLEALWWTGGIYLDSDVELYRPLDALLGFDAFAAWEDDRTIPDAVLGASPYHPAIGECLTLAVERISSRSNDWRTGNGPWATGPGVTTTVLVDRDDVTLLSPRAFFPYHYTERHRRHEDHRGEGTYGAHHWAGSWLPEEARR